jgi:RNA polymerase sigma factor (sigma-70 family)
MTVAMDATAARERFEALFERHHAAVAAYVRRRAPEALVEDVVEETFLVAWRALERLHDDPLPWLYGVARRILANQLRGERRRERLHARLARERRDAQPEALPGLVSGRLREALLALSETEREALLLVAWEGLTPAQAAHALGCSGPTFRARLHRARRRLERTLTPIAPLEGRLCEEES